MTHSYMLKPICGLLDSILPFERLQGGVYLMTSEWMVLGT